MINLFNVPISITSKSQALALVLDWVKEWRTANPSEHSENSDSRKVRQSENQKSRIKPSGSLAFRYSDSSGSPSIPSFPKIVVTPNPEMIVAAQTDPEFLKALQSADLAIPDGIGIVWALKCLSLRGLRRGGGRGNLYKSDSHAPISSGLGMTDIQISNLSRLSGLDLMESLIREPQKVGPFELKVMLLGGKPGVADRVAGKLQLSVLGFRLSDSSQPVVSLPVAETEKLKTGKPETENRKQKTDNRLQIKSISGPQNISTISASDNDLLISRINSFFPDLLFVAFGHGKQEKWLAANRHRLNAGVAMGVGGALDQIADPSLRPPPYINSIGLGWLYRLLREPRRWKRQLALIRFVMMVLQKKILSSEHSEYSESRILRKSDDRKAGNFKLLTF